MGADRVWVPWGGGGVGGARKAPRLLNLAARLFDSRRCPHAANEAKRMPPVENLTQHDVMAAATPDKR